MAINLLLILFFSEKQDLAIPEPNILGEHWEPILNITTKS